ncbi:MAG TPA: mechanosensitive ion channel domain-containing protein, partial [Bradyrhizobium sp.]|nr:mechanosensitive ion channel domain-containing protein [Bradyrhizobium sp.]
AESPDEQAYAQAALRIADHALAFAFTTALRDVEAHPPALSPEAQKIQDRIRNSQALLDADQQRVKELTAAIAQAKESQKDTLQDELDIAQSQLDLDQDELAEANQDLVEAGGNLQKRIEALEQEHDSQVKARTAAPASAVAADEQHGSWSRLMAWHRSRQKQQEVDDAKASSDQKTANLTARRTALAASLENIKGGISELAHHTKSAKDRAAAAAPAPRVQHNHEDAAALLNQTKQVAADQKVLTLLDRRIADQKQLAGVYGQWSAAIAAESRLLAHALLLNALIVIVVLIALLLIDRWLEHMLDTPKLDRRQVETLRSITRVSLRVVAAIVILLILIGIPTQFGTMIGIVGAGLTVALKDFIVAFFGWLVLMGRNGIRLGDWVEINGVSGEVTELGMFHTVLMETGNWSDAGHPTGRRVTFTNSFAIERHYFNFSTSGQWLWDELQVVVPAGRDPYPIVDAITKRVVEATAESARQAEQEWQRAVPAQRGKVFLGTPGVNVKPVVGGVEIAIRYITRANERFLLRAKLYQAAVDLLGEKSQTPP